MNGHLRTHGKHMLVGGAAVAVLMIVLGAGWQQAMTWGLLLACPLGMLGMMWFMGRQASGGHQHDDGRATGNADSCHTTEVPQQRVSEAPATEHRPGA